MNFVRYAILGKHGFLTFARKSIYRINFPHWRRINGGNEGVLYAFKVMIKYIANALRVKYLLKFLFIFNEFNYFIVH